MRRKEKSVFTMKKTRFRRGRSFGLVPDVGGFTLIEVLVALSVIAIALAAVLKGASEGASSVRYLRDKTFAHWVAMNTIAEVQVRGEWPAPGSKEGEDAMGNRDWHWRQIVSDTPDADLRRLEVEVRYVEEDEEPVVTRVAFIPRPLGP